MSACYQMLLDSLYVIHYTIITFTISVNLQKSPETLVCKQFTRQLVGMWIPVQEDKGAKATGSWNAVFFSFWLC